MTLSNSGGLSFWSSMSRVTFLVFPFLHSSFPSCTPPSSKSITSRDLINPASSIDSFIESPENEQSKSPETWKKCKGFTAFWMDSFVNGKMSKSGKVSLSFPRALFFILWISFLSLAMLYEIPSFRHLQIFFWIKYLDSYCRQQSLAAYFQAATKRVDLPRSRSIAGRLAVRRRSEKVDFLEW